MPSGIFNYLVNAVTGRIKHWNETNNVVVKEIWTRIEELPKPFTTVYKHFLISAGIVVESLVGPNRQSEGIIDIDLKELRVPQLRKFYALLLCYFVFLFYRTNPFLKKELQKHLLQVTREPDLARVLFSSLEKVGTLDMTQLSVEVWKKVVDTVGFGDEMHTGQWVCFGITAGNAYVEAAKVIRVELGL
jgi:hypothetical protein